MAFDGPVTCMQQLHSQTQDLHQRAHALPFFQELLQGRLSLISYVAQLRALAVIHGVLERQMLTCDHPAVQAVLPGYMPKLPLLQRDLAQFSHLDFKDILPAVTAALSSANWILLCRETDPVSLLGYLYVLEGSTLGGKVLQPHVSRTLNLASLPGTEFLNSYGSAVGANWEQFTLRMNAAVPDAAIQERLVQAARQAFEHLIQLYEALHPYQEPSLGFHVTSINPEAGSHPIPQDPRQIEAAIAAARRCWNTYPYLARRYGQRGWRFTMSDATWLVTLCELEPNEAVTQIRWLASLLASRGMPRIILDRQLRMLHEDLSMTLPDQTQSWQRLLPLAEDLCRDRRRFLDDATFESLSAGFDHAADPETAVRLPRTGELLVCGACDDRAGLSGSLDSLTSWLTDPARFPPSWIQAVQTALEQTRQHLA